ncbi:hypothetical protein Tco_0035467 [Tanacetum coccineum]
MTAATKALIAAVVTALPSSSPPPSPLPQIPSASLPIPSPPLPPTYTSLTYADAPLGYRETMIQSRVTSPSTHHPSEIPSPPLLLPSTTHRDDIPEADIPLWKRARFTAPTSRFEVGESSVALLLDIMDWMVLLWIPPLDILCLERLAMRLRMFGMTWLGR